MLIRGAKTCHFGIESREIRPICLRHTSSKSRALDYMDYCFESTMVPDVITFTVFGVMVNVLPDTQ